MAQGVGEFHDAQLFAGGGQDYAYFAGANPAVDSNLLELDGLLLVGRDCGERRSGPVNGLCRWFVADLWREFARGSGFLRAGDFRREEEKRISHFHGAL